MKKDHVVILCAEDNQHDVFLSQQAAKSLGLEFDFRYVPDGSAVIKWLAGEGTYANRDAFPLPDCVVTDLKMDNVDGLNVVRWIREHPTFKDLPVIIHAGSEKPDDIITCHLYGATHYIPKDARCIRLIHYLKVWFTEGPL